MSDLDVVLPEGTPLPRYDAGSPRPPFEEQREAAVPADRALALGSSCLVVLFVPPPSLLCEAEAGADIVEGIFSPSFGSLFDRSGERRGVPLRC